MLIKLFKYLFYLSVVTIILASISVYCAYRYYSYDLPDFRDNISSYKPKLINEIYTSEGYLLAEFFSEYRRIISFSEIPIHVVNSFVAVEDRRFYEHRGVDVRSIFAAAVANIREREIIRGGSTITQQVTKNIVLSPERSFSRKIKEAILAYRIEKNLSKEEILYLYLNHIYLGDGSYGVESASRRYFGKSVKDINIAEAALLAGLPKRPERYNPRKNLQRAIDRQQTVLSILYSINYISKDEFESALKQEITIVDKESINNFIAPYFVEYIRQYIENKFGTTEFLKGGYKVFTSIDTELSLKAQWAIRKGVIDLEKRRGRDEIVKTINKGRFRSFISSNNVKEIHKNKIYQALVVNVKPSNNSNLNIASLKIGDHDAQLKYIISEQIGKKIAELEFEYSDKFLPVSGFKGISLLYKQLEAGNVINVRVIDRDEDQGIYITELYYKPETQAAILVMDTNGFIRVMVGGYDYTQSQFNRSTQALRQPGSSFKPILYSSAINKGYTASSIIYDIPVSIKDWTPDNYDESFLGPILLKDALSKSRNLASVQLILNVTPRYVVDYSRRFRFSSKLNPFPSLALGGSETTLIEMVKAFNIFATGGRYVEPKFIYRIYDRDGKILEDYTKGIYFSKKNALQANRGMKRDRILKNLAKDLGRQSSLNTSESFLREKNLTQKFYKEDNISNYNTPDNFRELLSDSFNIPFVNSNNGEQVISPENAYIMTYMLQKAVTEGTGKRAKSLNDKAPIAGKTGTTNDFTDALFIGYSPKIVAGVWVGRDNHKTLGNKEAGSKAALPIWIDFMDEALNEYSGGEFNVPDGIKIISTPYGDLPYDISVCADSRCEYYLEQAISYKKNSNISNVFLNEGENEADYLLRR